MRFVHIVVSWLALICYIALLGLVLYQKKGEERTGQRFVLYLFNMLCMQILYLFVSLATTPGHASFLYILLIPLATGQPILYYLFTRAFLGHSRSKYRIGLSAVTWVLITTLSIGPARSAIYPSIHRDEVTGLFVPEFGPLVPLLAVPVFIFWGLAIANLFKEFRTRGSYLNRVRTQYLLLGTSITLLGLGINFLPALKPYPIDVIANILNALLIAYAILRYHLLDISIIVRQGLLQAIPILMMIVAYFLIIYMTTRLFEVLEGPQILFIAIIVGFVTTMITQPFHGGVQRWLEKALFREKYDSTMMIQRLSQISTTMLDLEELTSTILKDVTETLHIEWAAFFLDQDDNDSFQLIAQRGLGTALNDLCLERAQAFPNFSDPEKVLMRDGVANTIEECQALRGLEELEVKRLIPLRARGELIGVLVVGPKWAEHPYTQEDELTLTTLANQTGVALDNARLHQQSLVYAAQLEQRVQARTNELQAQYARLNAILQSTTNGIVVVSDDGHIIQVNPMARMWLNQMLDTEDAAQLRYAIQNLARETVAATGTAEAQTRILELESIDLALSAAPVRGTEGPEASTVVINIHDVSHLKALERMKTSFVTHVSHELRTPITAIKLYAHLIQQHPERLETYLPLLIQQTDHQAQLVQDIVAIARLDSQSGLDVEQTTLQLQRMNLYDLVRTVVGNHQAMARQRGLTLIHQEGTTALTVISDADYISQALENVLKNAMTYTSQGGSVTISVKAQSLEGKLWATVDVIDTGIGIPEDEFPHIFDRFFRGKYPRTMQMAGTGLGLAVAQAIVRQHGGRMTATSQENVGSTFTIWLPLAE
jgi:signal transduction histidine kinase